MTLLVTAIVVLPRPFEATVMPWLLSEPEFSTPAVPMVLALIVPFIDAPAFDPGARLMLIASSNACWMLLLLMLNVMSVVPLVLTVTPPPTESSLPPSSRAVVVFSVLPVKVMFIGPLASASVAAWKWSPLLRSEEHTSELQSRQYLVCRLLLEKKKKTNMAQQT